jgi:hypothetical protein
MWRIPDNEPATPRLREIKRDLDCVGFVDYSSIDDGAE